MEMKSTNPLPRSAEELYKISLVPRDMKEFIDIVRMIKRRQDVRAE